METFELAKQCFIGGLQSLQQNNLEGAEAQFERSLKFLPGRPSTLNNLAGVKLKLGKFAEAESFARKVIAAEPDSPEGWANLGIALARTGRWEEALQAQERALQSNPDHINAWIGKAESLLGLKRFDDALSACEESLKLEPEQDEVLHAQSLALKELGRSEEARKVYTRSLAARVARSPVHLSPRRASQKADVLVIHPDPSLDDSLKPFAALHLAAPNFPSQLVRLLQDDFHFTSVFLGEALNRLTRGRIPQPDLVINNCTNAESIAAEGSLAGLIEAVDGFGVPVVNHPSQAMSTARDATAKLLEDIPGIRMPKTRRFSSVGKSTAQLIAEIERQFAYPLITRSLSSQEGKGMTKVDSPEALRAVLEAGLLEQFFVTEFVDSRGGNEFYRKVRAAFVRDEMVVVRVDHDTQWKIYARKSDERVAFYLSNAHLLAAEKRICADPERELGRTAVLALRAIRDRIPLDVFGVDFDVDAAGELVFYEANATMNLLSTARPEVPYPPEANERLLQAMRSYFGSLVTRCGGV